MRSAIRGVLSALLALPWAGSVAGSVAAQGTIAFTNVDLLPMDREGVLAAQTVVVRDGVIASLGPAGNVDCLPEPP